MPRKVKVQSKGSTTKKQDAEQQKPKTGTGQQTLIEEKTELSGRKTAKKQAMVPDTPSKISGKKRSKRAAKESNLQKPGTLEKMEGTRAEKGKKNIKEPGTVSSPRKKSSVKKVVKRSADKSVQQETMSIAATGASTSAKQGKKSGGKASKKVVELQPTMTMKPLKSALKKADGGKKIKKHVTLIEPTTTVDETPVRKRPKRVTTGIRSSSAHMLKSAEQPAESGAPAAAPAPDAPSPPATPDAAQAETTAKPVSPPLIFDETTQFPMPTSEGETVTTADETSSSFIADLDSIPLNQIKTASLNLQEEVLPLYFGDFSIPEVLTSFNPDDAPMTEETTNREPGPTPGTERQMLHEEITQAVQSAMIMVETTDREPGPTHATETHMLPSTPGQETTKAVQVEENEPATTSP